MGRKVKPPNSASAYQLEAEPRGYFAMKLHFDTTIAATVS